MTIVARTRALAAASRDAIERANERICDTVRIIDRVHALPDFKLPVRANTAEDRAAAIEVSAAQAEQREIEREVRATITGAGDPA